VIIFKSDYLMQKISGFMSSIVEVSNRESFTGLIHKKRIQS